ncbi:peptidoglycan-binding domain-containing protein [Nakamurella aerolata]|uniref:Peptidoglycan-binding protein n=1 Tax=Nakamurella aerolata TaxID=1656892 RepID=A0A849A9V1_9ACTN|nr:peptidoglycan-binding domain-containing protein [Nakamurella aerolata]NNG36747.1 peptidoglycan-binding protein [Nakamurella aerolata]
MKSRTSVLERRPRSARRSVLAGTVAAAVLAGGVTTVAAVSADPAPETAAPQAVSLSIPAGKSLSDLGSDPLNAVAARGQFWVSASSPYSNIRALQFLLNAYGFNVSSTGKYDTATKNAVIKFQRAKGLEQDGSAGPITMRAMVGGANTAARYRWPNRNTTKAVQQLLIKFGYNQVADGDFGPVTRMNTINFQKAKGLPQTGIVDYATWTFLFNPPPSQPSGSDTNFSKAFLAACEDSQFYGLSPRNYSSSSLTATRVKNARLIIAIGKQAKAPAKGIKIALMTAMQESMLNNLCKYWDHDSVGLYQQRVRYYGSGAKNKAYAAKTFYGSGGKTSGVLSLRSFYPSYLNWGMGYTAQRVQRSAAPGAYDKWGSMATYLYNKYAGSTPAFTG